MEQFKFEKFELSKEILKALEEMGFKTPTPIQDVSIPKILEGLDIIGQAQTGTGKTAAFGLPIINMVDSAQKHLQAVVLCPTRELAIQVTNELKKYTKYIHNLKLLSIYGGQSIGQQIRELKSGVQIIVGTPGRIMDHLDRKTLKMDKVKYVVLDEADEMLDMGFREDIEKILKTMPNTRQTVLFSATMPKQIIDITKKYQKKPQFIKMSGNEITVPLVEQHYFEIDKSKIKPDVCTRIIDIYNPKLAIIFCNTKRAVDDLVSRLQLSGYPADGLHGDLNQTQRNSVMSKFRNGIIEILVATDVAARGIDILNIEMVINYDIPLDEEYYVHRIGRTGRAGRSGRAFSLVVGKEIRRLQDIQRFTKLKMNKLPVPSIENVNESKINKFLETLKSNINQGQHDKYKKIITKLVSEGYESIDIATALLKMNFAAKKTKDNITEVKTKIILNNVNRKIS